MILKAGNPLLYRMADPIPQPQSQSVQQICDQMLSSLDEEGGLALAAPQIGLPLQLIIMRVPKISPHARYDFHQDPHHVEFPLSYIINPTLTPTSDEVVEGWESCLSLPGYRGKVERYQSISCTWQTLDGETVSKILHGFNARVFQHEYDHLQGITYIQRIKDLTTFTFIGENNE